MFRKLFISMYNRFGYFTSVLLCIELFKVLEAVKYDPDCVTKVTPKIRNYTSAQVAILIDASEAMEIYRTKLQEQLVDILTRFNENYRDLNGAFYFKVGNFSNGCFKTLENKQTKHFQKPTPDILEIYKNLFKENNKTFKNSKNNTENALHAMDLCERKLIKDGSWDIRECKKPKRLCVYHYFLLFTGSGYEVRRKACNSHAPLHSVISHLLNFAPRRHHRLIGFFPSKDLVEEYAIHARKIHLPYYGYSFDGEVENIKYLADHLLDAISRDTNGTFGEARPCIWKYPKGYNTLGL